MQQQHNESGHAIRPSWLLAIVAESQRVAGRAHVIELDDVRTLLTDFVSALPAPSSYVEQLVLRALLIDVAWRSAHTLHRRAHGGRPAHCTFEPAATLDPFWRPPPQHADAAFRAWLDAFSADFTRTHPASVAARAGRLIKQDYRRRWRLPDLARRFHVTPSQLRREFRSGFGVSIHEFQKTVRVLAAIEQLPKGKIEPIALDVGFRSTKDFYRAFKQLTGLTPAVFRRLSPHRAAQIIARFVN